MGIRRQIDYMIRNRWTPALEFSDDADIYLNTRMGPGYYDNRYWTMYKLPMFGCTDSSEVIREIDNCKSEFPNPKYEYWDLTPEGKYSHLDLLCGNNSTTRVNC